MSQNKEYNNTVICGVWERGNHLVSAPLDERAETALRKAFERGGKFFIRKRTQAARDAKENSPTHYVEFISAEDVQKFLAEKGKNLPRGL